MDRNPSPTRPQTVLAFALTLLTLGCSASIETEAMRIAPLLPGMGDHHFEITTSSEEAQQYFDQGLRFFYSFQSGEAMAPFREAQRLDPDCPMAHWGEAVAAGPTPNSRYKGRPDDPTGAFFPPSVERRRSPRGRTTRNGGSSKRLT